MLTNHRILISLFLKLYNKTICSWSVTSEEGSDTNNTDKSNSQTLNLTDLALGEGHYPDAGVGMSTPLPYPRNEKGTASVGQAYTANPSAQRTQHKSSSVESATREQNTSTPPDTVQPPPRNITEYEPGQEHYIEHYGAWSSTLPYAYAFSQ